MQMSCIPVEVKIGSSCHIDDTPFSLGTELSALNSTLASHQAHLDSRHSQKTRRSTPKELPCNMFMLDNKWFYQTSSTNESLYKKCNQSLICSIYDVAKGGEKG